MKKLFAILAACALMLSIVSCSQSGTSSSGTAPSDASSSSTAPSGASSSGTSSSGEPAGAPQSTEVVWPSSDITFVCNSSAGGTTDLMMRVLAKALQESSGYNVNVLNTTGGNGWVAYMECHNSAATDGSVLYNCNTPSFEMGVYDENNPREFTIDDYKLLCNHVSDPNVICFRNDETRWTDFASFIEYAKKNVVITPATDVTIASDDANMVAYLNEAFGTQIEIVQVDGAGDATTMLLGGDADCLISNVGNCANNHANGTYKVSCIFAAERSELIPDIATCEEMGLGAIYGASNRGYMFPQGVDDAIVEAARKTLADLIADPDVIAEVAATGAATNLLVGDEYYEFLDNLIDQTLQSRGRTR